MKKLAAFAITVAAVPALLGPSFAQSEKKPATSPAATETEKKATPAKDMAMKSLAGEIVTLDQGARTFTLTHMVDKKPVQMTFSVEDPTVFTQLKAGDHVKVIYAEMGDKRIARSVVKG